MPLEQIGITDPDMWVGVSKKDKATQNSSGISNFDDRLEITITATKRSEKVREMRGLALGILVNHLSL